MTPLSLLGLMCLLLVGVFSYEHKNMFSERLFFKQFEKQKENMCKTPQGRVIDAQILLGYNISTAEVMVPRSFFLDRCEESGLCFGEYCCSVWKEEKVKLLLKICNIVEKGRPCRNALVMATNHTKCYCRENLPNQP